MPRYKTKKVYKCKVCENFFLDCPSAKRETCSTKCQYKYLSELNSGEGHPQYKGTKETRVCEQCGELFKAYKSSLQKYCSKKCHNKSMEIRKEIEICPICGREFYHRSSKLQVYCSRDCFYEGNEEFLKSLNKKGELTKIQLEALEKGRLNGLRGHSTKCIDGHMVESKPEAEFDNWLFGQGIYHDIQIRVCSDRYWTCDFVLLGEDGETLWIEIDGLGEAREKLGIKKQFKEKINYYEINNFDYKIVTVKNWEYELEEVREWSEEHRLSKGNEFGVVGESTIKSEVNVNA